MKLKELLAGIGRMREDIEAEEGMLGFCRSQIGEGQGSRRQASPWEAECLARERRLEELGKAFAEGKMRALRGLEGLEERDAALFLVHRYLSFKAYKEIAADIHMSMSSVYRLRKRALLLIEGIEA